MADKLVLELQVLDNGTAVIKNFSQASKQAMGDVSRATQETSKFITDLKSNWALLATGVGASIYIFNQVRNTVQSLTKDFFAQEEAELKLGMAMRNQGDYTREAFADMKQFASSIQETTVYADELALSIMGNLKTYGMTNEEVKRATKIAIDFSAAKKAEGMTVESASELIGRAYIGNTERLKRYGIIIDDTGGRAEKFNQVMMQLQERFGGSAQAELQTYSGQWKYLGNIWGEVKEVLGLGILKAIEAVGYGLSTLGGFIYQTLHQIAQGWAYIFGILGKVPDILGGGGFRQLNEWLQSAADYFGELSRAGYGTADSMLKMLKTFDQVQTAIEKRPPGKRFIPVDQEEVKALKKALDEEAKAWGDYADQVFADLDKMQGYIANEAKEEQKIIEKALEEEIKFWADYADEALNQIVKINAAEKKNYDERWKIERKIMEDVTKFTKNEYEFKKKVIDEEKEDYQQLGVDKNLIDKWYFIELKKLEEERILRSQDFFAGMKVAYQQDLREQQTWGEQGASIWRSVFGRGGALENTLSTFFDDVFRGELKSAQDYFNSFKNAILAAFAKMIAEMITMWTASKIAGLFGFSLAGTTANSAGNALGMALAGGGVAAAATGTGAIAATGLGAGAVGAGTMVGAGAGAGGTGAGAATGAAGAGMGGAAAAGAMGLGLAAYIYLGNKYFGGTQKYSNPFAPGFAGQSGLGDIALLSAGVPVALFQYPGSLSAKEYDIVTQNPFFSPDNLKNLYQSHFGFLPSQGLIDAGQPYLYLASLTEFKEAVEKLKAFVSTQAFGQYEGMQGGGIINEPVWGRGRSGKGYLFGEAGPERVVPLANSRNQNPVVVNINIDGNLIADKTTFNRFVNQIHERLTQLQNYGYR